MSAPDDKDRQINPHPMVRRMSLHKFVVEDLLRRTDAPNWNHPLNVNCEYCHRELTVRLYAPLNVQQFVKDEACRLAVLEHLRTEHVKSKSVSETSN
jgi:hypothetical protein